MLFIVTILGSCKNQYMEALTAELDPSIPIILLLLEGRPRLLQGLPQLADAVLLGYLPGPMGGQAVAEVVSGIVSPSGRLPFTYPKDHGSIPYPYHHKPSSQCTDPDDPFNYILCEVSYILRIYRNRFCVNLIPMHDDFSDGVGFWDRSILFFFRIIRIYIVHTKH
jgi:hypothetical protein